MHMDVRMLSQQLSTKKGIRVLEDSGFKKFKVRTDKSCIMGKSIIENI